MIATMGPTFVTMPPAFAATPPNCSAARSALKLSNAVLIPRNPFLISRNPSFVPSPATRSPANAAAAFSAVCTAFGFCCANSDTFVTTPATLSAKVPTTGKSCCPSTTPRLAMLFFAFSILAAVVSSICSNAACVAPMPSLAASIFSTCSLKPSTPSESNVTAAFPASADPNTSARLFPPFAASSCRMFNTSLRLLPSAISSLKPFPAAARSALSAVVPDFPSSFSILFMYVVDSAAAIPLLVMIAYPAVICSSATPFDFAVGIILPITEDNSATVTFPLFCVWISISDTLPTSSASSPYAFKIVVSTSSVCALSAKPAFASFVEYATKFTASAVSCPAEIALYTSSASAVAAMPVLFDNAMISFDIVSIGTFVPSAIVPTFASAVS